VIRGSTKVFAVIGDPIAHSLSPPIHNAAFRSLGMDCVYVALRVRRAELKAAIEGIRSLGIAGINVTMPHKTAVLHLLDRANVTAREIGAVNTVIRTDGGLEGHNTDGEAAVATLMSLEKSLSDSAALILGAGGAARAVVYHLSKTVAAITILNRTRSKASRIAAEAKSWGGIQCRSNGLNKTSLRKEMGRANVLINTLPVDIFPKFASMLMQQQLIRGDTIVLDVNYHSRNGFLAEARVAGAKVADGLDMLVRQAALSFRLWTGRDAPIEVMREVAVQSRAGP
jgi:shikimate dehydrogenase